MKKGAVYVSREREMEISQEIKDGRRHPKNMKKASFRPKAAAFLLRTPNAMDIEIEVE